MVMINFNIDKRYFYIIGFISIILVIIGVAIATGGTPTTNGHSYGEVGIPSCSDGQVLKYSGGSLQCGTDNTGGGGGGGSALDCVNKRSNLIDGDLGDNDNGDSVLWCPSDHPKIMYCGINGNSPATGPTLMTSCLSDGVCKTVGRLTQPSSDEFYTELVTQSNNVQGCLGYDIDHDRNTGYKIEITCCKDNAGSKPTITQYVIAQSGVLLKNDGDSLGVHDLCLVRVVDIYDVPTGGGGCGAWGAPGTNWIVAVNKAPLVGTGSLHGCYVDCIDW